MTKVINIFGAPGAGKSTTATGVFSKLKIMGYDVEYVPEYAKDLTWEKRSFTLSNQIYVFGKQYHRIFRLLDQVKDVVITDSPILLSDYYGLKYNSDATPSSFSQLVNETFLTMDNVNYYLNRTKVYNPNGRNQTAEESDQIGNELEQYLIDKNVEYVKLPGNIESIDIIVNDIVKLLGK